MRLRQLLWILLLRPVLVSAHHADKDTRGLRDVTVLIMRHTEKPDQGNGLSPRGEQRAQAYASYFAPFELGGSALMPQRLIATSDSKASTRPRLTLMPLAARLRLPIEQPWADDQVDDLAKALRKKNEAPVVLIAWRHGHIVKLIEALGGDARELPGRKTWPGDVYNQVVVLHFDAQGRLSESPSRLSQEHLLPGD